MTHLRLELSVEEARERIASRLAPLPSVTQPLESCLDLVLSEAIFAPMDLPRFTNSAMDGFAVRSAETAGASNEYPVRLDIAGRVEAGDAWSGTLPRSSALRISTGAALPAACDAVAAREHVTEFEGKISLFTPIEHGRHVRPRGEDIHAGDLAVASGRLLRPQDVALLAALGVDSVRVIPKPAVSIVSIGPELSPGALPLTIFDVNGPMLAAQTAASGGTVTQVMGSNGDVDALLELFTELAESSDLIVTSGGISDGDADTLANLLATLPDSELWNVRLRPGKHAGVAAFGGCTLLALPGNPVAAFTGFELFGRSALEQLAGKPAEERRMARASEALIGSAGRTDALRGRAWMDEHAQLHVQASGNRGAGIVSSLREANCLILIAESCERVDAGDTVEIHWLGYH